MSEYIHGEPLAEAQPLPPFRQELRFLYGQMLEAARESADGKLPGELVDRALVLDEHIAVARGDDGRPVRYYGPDEDGSIPFKAAQRVHNVAAAARNADQIELTDRAWKRVLAEAGIERDVQAEGSNAWLAEGYRRAYDDPEVAESLQPEDRKLLDTYTRQRQERIADGFATTPDEAVELLQHVLAGPGASSPEGTAALIKYNSLIDADVRQEFVEAAEAERDIAALGDEDIARIHDDDLDRFLMRHPHLTRHVLDRRDHGQSLLDEAYEPVLDEGEDPEDLPPVLKADAAETADAGAVTTAEPEPSGARPKPRIPDDWKLVASGAPLAEAEESTEDDEDERWRRMQEAFDRHAGLVDDDAAGGEHEPDDIDDDAGGRVEHEPAVAGEGLTDDPLAAPRPERTPTDFRSRLREMFAGRDEGDPDAGRPEDPERSRRRRRTAAVVGGVVLAGVLGYAAYRVFGTSPEHILPPGLSHLPAPGSSAGGTGGNGGNIARQSVESLPQNGTPWGSAEDALKQRGIAHPTNAQIDNEDYNVIGRNYFKTHRLGQFTASAWERVARHLPVGAKLRIR